MFCNKCGNELEDDMNYCNKCGNKIGEENNSNYKKQKEKRNKIRFKVADVVNKENVLNSTNKVAYIANGWALQVRNRGIDLAIVVVIIYFILAGVASNNVPYNDDGAGAFFSTLGIGVLYGIIIVMIFNTVAFIIRMFAEIIQLLDDIKNKKTNE